MRLGIWTPLPHTIRAEPEMEEAARQVKRRGDDSPDKSLEFALDIVSRSETLGFDITLIAERLLGCELRLKPELAREMIREALQLAVGAPRIRVHLHADDAALLGKQATEVVRALAACGEAAIVADNSLTRGGCLIETQHGQIDARIETVLDRLVAELLESQDL